MTRPVDESYEQEDKDELLKLGLQPLDLHPQPQGLYCKYAIDRECQGNILDPIRCSTLNMEDCDRYQQKEREKIFMPLTDNALAMSNPLEGTVEMTAEEIVNDSQTYDSLHDTLAEGEKDIKEYSSFRPALRTHPIDDRTD